MLRSLFSLALIGAMAFVLGRTLLSAGERPRRVVDGATGQCLGVEIPGPEGEKIKPCSWIKEHSTSPTDKDLFVQGAKWKALHQPED